ncbi:MULTISPECIES: histidine kinase dimerization/phosphoacceptor domain -containing protein [Rhizobium]|uniref:histidine kinase n=1 Tax=Rhizobium rhododendri TaxID=2506430 RepID=A0ABY8IN42_9HYPH|nr:MULTISPECIES: histidine kinase dimerization/phosphoacceptor domain -containing protein [Rhizobium]MBO9098785.1 response regulator [Rhizobium sp. L58/93]MBO9132410.1 response regulator [Rhizobium sp. B209b/85]MBO9169051.1 response regulator [Rhizobium sp. L245/93]MBO9185001.1 response regulator [Rhizobium sp. E27B/91]MBZ5758419.1 response regulator [Rhizobium sp. VS19-DR96]
MIELDAAADAAIHILYIDDDEALGVLTRKNMQRRGYELHLAKDGAAGLARLAEGGIDAIVLDHFLEGETGLDLLPCIVSGADHPPVIYATGSGDAGVAVAALKAGADDYVMKGVSSDYFDLLAAALAQGLERARFRRDTLRAQAVIRHERDRAELLLSEVNHRIANSLGLVAALIRMQASVTKDQVTIDALQETQIRINAIASVHRRLYTSHEVGTVRVKEYLESLLAELEASMRDEQRPHSVKVECDDVILSTDKVITLGLIISELVTNAYKYAYPAGQTGEIRVVVDQTGQGGLRVHVEDDGVGFDRTAPAKGTGLGTKILTAMASSLKSSILYAPDRQGTRAMLNFSID